MRSEDSPFGRTNIRGPSSRACSRSDRPVRRSVASLRQLAEFKNEVAALNRVPNTLGYKADLHAAMPRQKRDVLFGPGELTSGCLDPLRESTRPMPNREVWHRTSCRSWDTTHAIVGL